MVVMYMTTLINAKLKYTLDFYEFMLTSRKELPLNAYRALTAHPNDVTFSPNTPLLNHGGCRRQVEF